MHVLKCLLRLVSKQGDVTCAFLCTHLNENEKVSVDIPLGFKKYDSSGKEKVLPLKRTLYGLRQSPRAFWKYVTDKLVRCRMTQSKFDPCLFISEQVICIMHVDDLLFWSVDEQHIITLGVALQKEGVLLEVEGDPARFLGVKLTC